MIEFLLLGCFFGIITGMTPGFHINNVSLLLLFLLPIADLNIVILIVSMSITHSFIDFIPSIIFGAPEEESFLSVLPGHKMLMKGEGLLAIKLTLIGGLIAGIITIIISPIFGLLIVNLIPIITVLIPWILILLIFSMILSEKTKKQKIFAIIVIILSGLLGILVLRNFFPVNNSLMPLITGFFGITTLLYSIKEKTSIKKQKIQENAFQIKASVISSTIATIAASIVSIVPSIGASQAAFIVKKIVGKISTKNYLIILGGINTSNMIFSIIVLYLIGKTRTGTAAIIKQIIEVSLNEMILIILTMIISLGLGTIATLYISKFFVKNIHKIKYQKINIIIIGFLILLTFILSNFKGLAVLGLSTSIGLITISSHTKKTNCMAFLMLPTILFYLGL